MERGLGKVLLRGLIARLVVVEVRKKYYSKRTIQWLLTPETRLSKSWDLKTLILQVSSLKYLSTAINVEIVLVCAV